MFTKQEIMTRWAEKKAEAAKNGTELKADIRLALTIANDSLFDKKNRDGSPYITHPLTVAFNNTLSRKKQIVGLLHDVPEDTDWTLDDLREVEFDEDIVNGVDGMTSRKDEPYFDFIIRCAETGLFSIDPKIKDIDHNTKNNRTKEISPLEFHVLKAKAYNIAHFYLLAVKTKEIEPGTPMLDYIKSQPEYAQHPTIANELMDIFSSEKARLPVPKSPQIIDDAEWLAIPQDKREHILSIIRKDEEEAKSTADHSPKDFS